MNFYCQRYLVFECVGCGYVSDSRLIYEYPRKFLSKKTFGYPTFRRSSIRFHHWSTVNHSHITELGYQVQIVQNFIIGGNVPSVIIKALIKGFEHFDVKNIVLSRSFTQGKSIIVGKNIVGN